MGGIVALAVITAAVLFFVLRQKRRNRAAGSSMGLKDQWHTMPSNEKVRIELLTPHGLTHHSDSPGFLHCWVPVALWVHNYLP